MVEDKKRALLISVAWELKSAISKEPNALADVTHVDFNVLLRDPEYRDQIFKLAAESWSEKVADLGRRAQVLDVPGSLMKRSKKRDKAEAHPTTMEQHSPHEHRPGSLFEVLSPIRIAAGLILVVGLLGAGYFLLNSSDVDVSGAIFEDTVWKKERTYHLRDMVFVESGATLTIEPGTRILGHPGSALIVSRDADISARGTRKEPIVFTSAQPEGSRKRGDWGGVVLLGNAPVNTGVAHIEGIAKDDPRGSFGGNDVHASCGLLQYVRIEFAGFEISRDNELNGLTLGGCGDATLLRNVQVHMGLDDGIEFFGGSASLSYVVISRAGDDGLDWDRGWTGNGQFIVIQQGPNRGDNGIEADNYKKDKDAKPRSHPTLSNVTIVGSGNKNVAQRGMLLRRGTGADLRNFLITGFTKEALDLRDVETVALVDQNQLSMDGMLIANPDEGVAFFGAETGEKDDDGGFSEEAFFQAASPRNWMTTKRALSTEANALITPSFVPPQGSPAATNPAPLPQGEFWDEAASYIGAVRPGNRSSWLDGWTAFPDS
ncbi:MAG: hypothetical protein MI754_16325 [Chromatiales bacterium]|nr:hypothetical protein [Chromatiales bacterium]